MTDALTQITQGAFALAMQFLDQREAAEEVVQAAVVTALSHPRAPGRHTAHFRPWFFTVVRNKSLDRLRARKRWQAGDDVETLASENSSPESVAAQSQARERINAALLQLPVAQREIVLLRDYHGFRYAEIAAIADIPLGSVMSRLHRARARLRTLLQPLLDQLGDQ